MKKIWRSLLALLCAGGLMLSDLGSMGFAVPAVYTRELTASDQRTYRVTVSYDTDAGIPGDLALQVQELDDGEDGAYGEYVQRSTELLGQEREELGFARAFDIALVDPESGIKYQLDKTVRVSIRLLDENLGSQDRIGVVHFGDQAQVMDCQVENDAVCFATEGFSVFVITGQAAVPRRTYVFHVPTQDGYTEFAFTTAQGETVVRQTLKNGERPVVPQPPADEDRGAFAGWYEGNVVDGTLTLAETAYDFENIPPVTENQTVHLYAQYRGFAYVIFHDQYDEATETFPIAHIRRGELVGDAVAASIRIDDLTATYYGGESGAQMGFYGWSYTPVKVPGSTAEAAEVIPENYVSATENTLHLYPLFKPIHWLSYFTAAAGLQANYVPPVYRFEDSGMPVLPVPTRTGYTFLGWYNGALQGDGITVDYGVQVADARGYPINGVDDGGLYVRGEHLFLNTDVTLYAKWTPNTQATYRVAVWTQHKTDDPTAEKTYDFAQCDAYTGTVDGTVSVPASYQALTGEMYTGYKFASADEATTLAADGSTVLHVYYDIDATVEPDPGAEPPVVRDHQLTFADSVTAGASASLPVTVSLTPGTALADYAPSPASGRAGYGFKGWFYDEGCTLAADPDDLTMPDRALTLYAGWESIKYRVEIDPNYGSLRGTGATFFNNRVDQDPIQEYIQVVREYIPSSSGTWYYVKHDYDYYGGDVPAGADRETYYTQDPGEATEYTTFEYAPNYYRYAGWYEVFADGSEELYDFSRHTDHDTTLRLHWKKAGTFFVEYDAGAGTLRSDAPNQSLARALEGVGYTDDADVVVTCGANAPAGYTFAGWKLRGDPSGKVYGVGDTFTLSSDWAVTLSGKDRITLDAVYARIPTAQIVYDANGGTVGETVDYGISGGSTQGRKTHTDTTATFSGLENNSTVTLSDGTGFTRAGAVLTGWSDQPVYAGGASFYALGGDYGVDDEEPVILYAVWEVRVTYHLNLSADQANWGGDWASAGYTAGSGNTYYRTVPLGAAAPAPPAVPQYTGSDNLMFYTWRTQALNPGAPADSESLYDFTSPVETPLDLYAYWAGPTEIAVHGVDATAQALAGKDADWIAAPGVIRVGTQEIPLDETGAKALLTGGVLPAGYDYAFAAAQDPALGLENLSREKAVTALFYSTERQCLMGRRADNTSVALTAGEEIYLVLYQRRALDVGYVRMSPDGALTAVTVTGAPTQTAALGTCDVAELVNEPMSYPTAAGDLHYFAYAIGTAGAANASQLQLITEPAAAEGDLPALQVRNTWQGFQYSLDGESWVSCGYAPQLYTVYFESQPRVITIGEETWGTAAVREASQFQYEVTITDVVDGVAAGTSAQTMTFALKDGEVKTIAAYTWAAGGTTHTQAVSVTQTVDDDFTADLSCTAGTKAQANQWTYTTGAQSESPLVTFANRHKQVQLEAHVALLENGSVVLHDELRSSTGATLAVSLGETVTVTEAVDPTALFTGDTDVYAFGTVLAGAGDDALTVADLQVGAVTYGQIDGRLYEPVLDGEEQLGQNKLCFLYYKMPRIRYVKAQQDGSLTAVRGSQGGIVSDTLTYNFTVLQMNGQLTRQNQPLAVSVAGVEISQAAGARYFHMPPILDDGTAERYLTYDRLGIGSAGAESITALGENVSADKAMTLRLSAAGLEWSFDGRTWQPTGEAPVVYAIYTERGYDLAITKTVNTAVSGEDPVFAQTPFTVTLRSTAITKESYSLEGGDSLTVEAIPAVGATPGTITLTVRDGSKVKLLGLGRGEYTIIESDNDNYQLTAMSGTISGTSQPVTVTGNSSMTLTLDQERRVELTNTPKPVCKVVDEGVEHVFYTLTAAVNYVKDQIADHTAAIEMLTDYLVTDLDAPEIFSEAHITLTTAATGTYKYAGTGKAVLRRSAHYTGGPLFSNLGELTFRNVTVDGAGVSAAAPLVRSEGTLTVASGATLQNAVSTGSGGAIQAISGTVRVTDGSLLNNQAAAGGAVYSAGADSLALEAGARLAGNQALTGSGGAIWAERGTVTVIGRASLQNNQAASGSGGAIYGANVRVQVEQGASLSGNAARHGGAIRADAGAVTVSGGSLSGNTASSDGGAVSMGAGIVTVNGGSLTGNTAAGVGGAICLEGGSAALSAGSLTENQAANGAALMAKAGTAAFSGTVEITGNTATAGGAVGVGSAAVKLTFSGSPSITGNTLNGAEANVYLDQDSDGVLTAAGLEDEARIGIYVAGALDGELFLHRGVACAKFASYTSEEGLTAFVNDRQPALRAMAETASKKVIWGKALQVEVRYLANFSNYPNGFPPKSQGSQKYTAAEYYPKVTQGGVSQLAEDLYSTYQTRLTTTAAYAMAFANGATTYEEYLTRFRWDSDLNDWAFQKQDGTSVQTDKVILYYAEPAFLSIENNTGLPLKLTRVDVLNVSTINREGSPGYGLVFARNGAIQQALLPVTADDLNLAVGASLRIMVPGAVGKNYILQGLFTTDAGEEIRVRRTGLAEETLTAQQVQYGFALEGNLSSTAGGTHEIIFGEDRPVCKIVHEGEHIFSSISGAVEYAVANHLTTVTIEMLVDYLLPARDSVAIPQGYDVTLTTATTGTYRYSGARASISRDTENTNPFITAIYDHSDSLVTKLTVENLNLDGKSIRGSSDGGAIRTKNALVTVRDASFVNFIAYNGGGMFVEFDTQTAYDYANRSKLVVENAVFRNCSSISTGGTNRDGGGAIWTNAQTFNLSGSQFENCIAGDQGGAVFHRIDYTYAQAYRENSRSAISGCTFSGCKAKAAGGLELDAYHTSMTGCTFNNCQGTNRNSGGFNVFIQCDTDGDNVSHSIPSDLLVEDCTFTNCTANNRGGGMRSLALETTVRNCTFTGNIAVNNGGGIAITNTLALRAEILGCTITGCTSSKMGGGGVYCSAQSLTVGDDTRVAGAPVHTTIDNCRAGRSGGGICHDRSTEGSVFTMENATISNCTITTGGGGGVYTNARSASVTGVTLENNTAASSGGGFCQDKDNTGESLILSGCTITGNTAGAQGGGVYTRLGLVLKNGTQIRRNRLTTDTAENAAGVYLWNNRILTVGTLGATEPDNSSVTENTTVSGAPSNLRLWENSGANHPSSVSVLCHLSGAIGVVNAKSVGKQFGSAAIAKPDGFSDSDPVFTADDGTIHGIIDRTDSAQKKIIWGGPPVCKITDADGRLLYLKNNGGDPAVFDRLDNGGTGADETGAFALLKRNRTSLKLYYADGTPYTGDTFCVKMLVSTFVAQTYITTNKANANWMKIIFTTADPDDTDGYPYQGRAGTRATVVRGSSIPVKDSFVTAKLDMTLENIILDGGSLNGITTSSNGGVLLIKDSNATTVVTLGANATLQNGATTGSGGGVHVNTGKLAIRGGSIRNCKAANGGGVSVATSGQGLSFSGGNIFQCTATGKGGGVDLETGTFQFQDGTIDRCKAPEGAGVYIADSRTMELSGGFITGNTATERGGGVAVGGGSARLVFSEKPTVSGNKLGDATCNVELRDDTNQVIRINKTGLFNGAHVGVYVAGEEGTNSLYDRRGQNSQPFGYYPDDAVTGTLYGFFNDRNGLKGGLVEDGDPNTIYWVMIFSLEVSKEIQVSQQVPMTETVGAASEEFEFQVTLHGLSSDGSVAAEEINGERGEMTFQQGVATFRLKGGEKLTAENLPAGLTYEVEEKLTTQQRTQYAALPKEIQTGDIGENSTEAIDPADWYVSKAAFTNLMPVCKITDANGNLLYRRYEGETEYNPPAVYAELSEAFNALSGTLYVSFNQYARSYDGSKGYQVQMLVDDYTLNAPLTVPENVTVTLTQASPAVSQFPYRGSGPAVIRRGYSGDALFDVQGQLALAQITLDGQGAAYTATGDGGFAAVADGGRFALRYGATLQNALTEGRGGAVYVAPGGTAALTGGAVKANQSVQEGAGLYLAQGSTLELSGALDFGGSGINTFGDIDATAGNLRVGELAAKTNGGMTYTRARQDIYLAETETDPATMVLTGDLTGGAGSIWVWAESPDHCQTLMPFARIQSGVTLNAASRRIFRNASTDDLTGCAGAPYLSGSAGERADWVYWSGGMDVVLRKIDGFGKALGGAKFSLYQDYACTSGVPVTVESQSVTEFTSADSFQVTADGVRYNVSFGVAPGVYYLKETAAPSDCEANDKVYRLIAGEAGAQAAGVTLPEGSEFLLQRMADETTPETVPDLAATGVLNISKNRRRVLLKKIDDVYTPVEGAKFDILRYDGTAAAKDCVSGGPGCFWTGELPYGYYYLHETQVPQGYQTNGGGWWFTLRVDQNGASILRRSETPYDPNVPEGT